MLFFLILFCGLLRTKIFTPTSPKDITEKNVVITGIVRNITPVKNFHRVLIKTIDIYDDHDIYIKKNLNIYAYLSDKKKQSSRSGEKIILCGKLTLPDKKRNPSGFDEEKYFRIHSLAYKIFPEEIKNCGITNYFFYYLQAFKNKLSSVYDLVFSKKDAGVIKSMIIGDKSDLDYYTGELYKSAGIYHILAISGLHISVVAIFFSFIFKLFFRPKIAGIISILLLILYCLMTGSSVSTVRAVIMASIIIIGNMIYRESDLLTSLSFACLILCIYNPFCIFDTGFEYSFGAVFGIATCNKTIQKVIDSAASRFSVIKLLFENELTQKYFSASVSASLITHAVTAGYFYYFTPYSIFINIFILPSVSIVVVFGFLVGLLGLININLGALFSAPVFIFLWLYELISKVFTVLPFFKIVTGHVNILLIILYFIWVFLFMYAFAKDSSRIKKYWIKFSILSLMIIIIKNFIPKEPEVVMLDVGQGDCFIIDCGQTFVIDGGGKMTQEIGENTGTKILIPFLDYRAKNYIDAAFVSHSDADHIIGIIELIKQKRVGEVFVSKKIFDDDLSQELISAAEKFSVSVNYLSAGDYLKFKKASFECLYPFENTKADNNNDTSIVLKLNICNTDILFTGDIEKNAEQEILKSDEDIHADILKLAHHGSKTSSTLEFVKKVNPQLAIASNGVKNNYGHPSKEIVERLKNLNIPLINTSEYGAVTLKFKNNQIEIMNELEN